MSALLWHAGLGFTVCWSEPVGSFGREMQVWERTGPHLSYTLAGSVDTCYWFAETVAQVTKDSTINKDLLMCSEKTSELNLSMYYTRKLLCQKKLQF